MPRLRRVNGEFHQFFGFEVCARAGALISRLRVRRLEDLGVALGMFDRDAPRASQFDDAPRVTTLPSYLNVSQCAELEAVAEESTVVF